MPKNPKTNLTQGKEEESPFSKLVKQGVKTAIGGLATAAAGPVGGLTASFAGGVGSEGFKKNIGKAARTVGDVAGLAGRKKVKPHEDKQVQWLKEQATPRDVTITTGEREKIYGAQAAQAGQQTTDFADPSRVGNQGREMQAELGARKAAAQAATLGGAAEVGDLQAQKIAAERSRRQEIMKQLTRRTADLEAQRERQKAANQRTRSRTLEDIADRREKEAQRAETKALLEKEGDKKAGRWGEEDRAEREAARPPQERYGKWTRPEVLAKLGMPPGSFEDKTLAEIVTRAEATGLI